MSSEHHPIHTAWDGDHPGFEAGHSGTEAVEGLGKYDRVAPAIF